MSDVQLNNYHSKHLALALVEQNCYIIVQDFTENESRFHLWGNHVYKGGARDKTV